MVVVRKKGRPRMHPQGISTVLITLQDKDVIPGPNSNYINILMANSRIRSLSSITYGTLENYKVGWKAYVSFKHKLRDRIAVDFQIPSSKTDQAGLGIPFYSPWLRVGKKVAFDVVKTIYNWSGLARPAVTSGFP